MKSGSCASRRTDPCLDYSDSIMNGVRVVRTCYPVGHGGFSVERLFVAGVCRFTAIYDCGSKSKSLIEGMVRHAFLGYDKKKEVVDAVFLSHFDDDHINGLPFLFSRCDIKKIYFPLVTKSEEVLYLRFISLVASKTPEEAVTFQLLGYLSRNDYSTADNRVGWLRNSDADFVGVKPDGQLDVVSEENVAWANRRVHVTKAGDPIPLGFEIDWIYVPYTIDIDNACERFHEKLLEKGWLKEIEDGTLMSRTDKEVVLTEIRKLYLEVSKGTTSNPRTNLYSMVLFSGSTSNWGRTKLDTRRVCCNSGKIPHPESCCSHLASGCLYTGDYSAKAFWKWNKLEGAFGQYKNLIGCIQLPHHGSVRNYNPGFCSLNSESCFVVFANPEDAKHPAESVRKSLQEQGRCLYVVTRDPHSKISFRID